MNNRKISATPIKEADGNADDAQGQKELLYNSLPLDSQRWIDAHPYWFPVLFFVIKIGVAVRFFPTTLKIWRLKADTAWLHLKLRRAVSRNKQLKQRLVILMELAGTASVPDAPNTSTASSKP